MDTTVFNQNSGPADAFMHFVPPGSRGVVIKREAEAWSLIRHTGWAPVLDHSGVFVVLPPGCERMWTATGEGVSFTQTDTPPVAMNEPAGAFRDAVLAFRFEGITADGGSGQYVAYVDASMLGFQPRRWLVVVNLESAGDDLAFDVYGELTADDPAPGWDPAADPPIEPAVYLGEDTVPSANQAQHMDIDTPWNGLFVNINAPAGGTAPVEGCRGYIVVRAFA